MISIAACVGGFIIGFVGYKIYKSPRVRYFVEWGYWPSKKEWEEA